MASHAEDIQKHVRVYMAVFASLGVLTIMTVAVSYVDAATSTHIAVAMLIATIKAALVALYFMHLVSEQRAIYWLLALTVVFFLVLMYMPNGWRSNSVTAHSVWDAFPAAQMESHGAHGAAGGDAHGEEGGHH